MPYRASARLTHPANLSRFARPWRSIPTSSARPAREPIGDEHFTHSILDFTASPTGPTRSRRFVMIVKPYGVVKG